ncbi:MAG: NAD-glutamate dehydrogenase domain-containing protein, partial [Solirubrobacteraceae bacterium]
MLESFGLVVEESVPYRFELRDGLAVSIDDVGVHLTDLGTGANAFSPGADGPRLVEALDAVVAGRTEGDPLNRLVVASSLTWREVSLLRAYMAYWAQCDPPISAGDVEEALVAFPAVSRTVVTYFAARFDPMASGTEAAARAASIVELAQVPLLRWDRALRVALGLVDATVRTNFYQRSASGEPKEAVTLKFESASVPTLRRPHPLVETWVHARAVEGIHLRAGLVARGGIRWSERPGDFRTEVLDLMVAQVKKNAIIVPTGAKGGFVCRPTGSAAHAKSAAPASPADVRRCYETFVSSLLDITDDLVGGKVVGPSDVVVHDGPDPYLVVAADKGTAELSDLANELSSAHGFWLADAFASGGSHGYNHKAMGITARGAWVAVRRHFHQLGIDVQREPVRVAGIGDMSGDVFGNGMLQSRQILLLAAFNHRHIFIDPKPDRERSRSERARLFSLPRSGWNDYRRELLSRGGAVYERCAKSVLLSAEARSLLELPQRRASPSEVIRAILCM